MVQHLADWVAPFPPSLLQFLHRYSQTKSILENEKFPNKSSPVTIFPKRFSEMKRLKKIPYALLASLVAAEFGSPIGSREEEERVNRFRKSIMTKKPSPVTMFPERFSQMKRFPSSEPAATKSSLCPRKTASCFFQRKKERSFISSLKKNTFLDTERKIVHFISEKKLNPNPQILLDKAVLNKKFILL